MSTIVVVRKGQTCCIAADSMTSFGDMQLSARYERNHDKIQTFGRTHIGIVGSAAHTLVVENAMRNPELKPDFSSRDAIFNTLLRLHRILKDDYFLTPKDAEDDPYESSHIDAVIATAHGIFGIYALREVYEYDRFWAVGSGAPYALGAMQALYASARSSAHSIARAGVEAGAEFDNATALPLSSKQVRLRAVD